MWQYIIGALAGVSLLLLLWILQPYLVWRRSSGNSRKGENIVIVTKSTKIGLKEFLQSKNQNGQKQVQISLVVPSYNEELRLPIMLEESVKYLKDNQYNYEILVVNDGSKDRTTEVALKKGEQLGANLYVVEYPKNRGKGGAVRAGMAAATGKNILMVDADGATTFSQLGKMMKKINQIQQKVKHPLIMVVGSRKMLEEQAKVQRKIHRKLVSAVFGFIKGVVLGIKTKDTQCGFKLFTKQSAQLLFGPLHIQRWAFDIQLFVLSSLNKVQVAEVPVEWKDVDGSKLNVIEASVNMFRDVLMIRFLYLLGLWSKTDRIVIQ